jgi:hypothetical protein
MDMRQLFFLLLMGLTIGACQNDGAQGGEATGENTETPRLAKPIPNTREAQLLLRDYWVFEYFIAPNDRVVSDANRGNWYKFSADGTCIAGHWQDYETTGTWALFYGDQYPIIRIIAENNRLTGEYQIQGISATTEYMSWVGTARYDQKGYAAKVMNLLSEPTRKQFGVEQ